MTGNLELGIGLDNRNTREYCDEVVDLFMRSGAYIAKVRRLPRIKNSSLREAMMKAVIRKNLQNNVTIRFDIQGDQLYIFWYRR